MNENAQALLYDIAKLLRKHGPAAFEALHQTITSGEFLRSLERILDETAKVGKQVGIDRKHGRPKGHIGRSVRTLLLDLAEQQAEKGRLLIDFYDSLVAGRYLPKLRDIRDFAADAGLPPVKATSRAKAIDLLVHALGDVPMEKLASVLSRAKRVEVIDDRSLAGWSNVILRDRGRLREGPDNDQSNQGMQPTR
jgi:hypothetical protein